MARDGRPRQALTFVTASVSTYPGRHFTDPGPTLVINPRMHEADETSPGVEKRGGPSWRSHTLLKIAYSVLKTGMPYRDLGEDFYARRDSPAQRQAYLERQIRRLYPDRVVTITVSPAPGSPVPATGTALTSPGSRRDQ